MNKYISISLCGSHPLYDLNARINATIYRSVYPGWKLRFYCYKDVLSETIEYFKKCNCEVVMIDNDYKDEISVIKYSMFWRFYIMDDPNVDLFIVRDADSILSDREAQAVNEWIISNKSFHIMHDNPRHDGCSILGGMWGAKTEFMKQFKFTESLEKWINKNDPDNKRNGTDQVYLLRVVLPVLQEKNDYIAHGHCPNTTKRFGIKTLPFPNHTKSVLSHLKFIGQPNNKCFYCGNKLEKDFCFYFDKRKPKVRMNDLAWTCPCCYRQYNHIPNHLIDKILGTLI